MKLSPQSKIVLGSGSPRRLELLSTIIPRERIRVAAPLEDSEPGFAEGISYEAVQNRIQEIARWKAQAFLARQIVQPEEVLLTADTVVIARSWTDAPIVLGKPDGPHWQATVRRWLEEELLGQRHHVATAVCLADQHSVTREFLVVTEVRFRAAPGDIVDWYLRTEDSLGKAGGYGIQSAGGIFVESVNGSLSNVIGLPLFETWDALREIGVI